MVDSSDDERIKECNDELRALLQEAKLSKVPVLIFANKQDLPTSLSAEEVFLIIIFIKFFIILHILNKLKLKIRLWNAWSYKISLIDYGLFSLVPLLKEKVYFF